MNIDVCRIKAILSPQAPVAFDFTADSSHHQVLHQESRWNVFLQTRSVAVTNENKDHPVRLPHGIRLDCHFPNQRTAWLSQNPHEFAVTEIIGESMIPTGNRLFCVAFDLSREGDSSMGTAVRKSEHLAVYPPQKDTLAEHLHWLRLITGEVVAEQGRIPVIAKASLCLHIRTPRLLDLLMVGGIS